MVARVRAFLTWAWFDALYMGSRVYLRVEHVAKLTAKLARHLKERWMSKRSKRDRRKIVEDRVNRVVSKGLNDLYRQKAIELWEMNYWIAKFAEAGIHDVGYEPDPRLDPRCYGKPWWSPTNNPNSAALKKRIVGRLMAAGKAMGEEHPGLTVAEIKARIKPKAKENGRTHRKTAVSVKKVA